MNKMVTKDLLYKGRSFIGLFLLCFILAVSTDRFLTISNLTNVFRQTSLNATMAVGMTFVILTAGIDLSVGSVFAFCGAITAGLIVGGMNPALAILLALALGTVIGMITGTIITKGKVAPFICTLAMMTIFRGATLIYTKGRPITGLGDSFRQIGWGEFLGVPIPTLITILSFLFAYVILKYTRLGRYTYAVGGNEEASRLSGINVDHIKIYIYGICGFLAALSGIIATSRLDSAPPTAGTGAELDAIAAVVLGGTSLAGGVGNIFGTFIGAVIIGVLSNGLNLLDVNSHYQMVAKGLVILIAVLLDKKS